MSTTPPPKQKTKPQPRTQDNFSWLDVVMPRQAVTRYGAQSSPEATVQAIKALDNHTSRNVTIAKRPTPQGLVYSFRVEFREKKIITVQVGIGLNKRMEKRPEWQTMKQIDGTIKAGTDYPTIIEVTPERQATSLFVVIGFFILLFILIASELPTSLKTPLLIGLVILAAILFLSPYMYVTYGPKNTSLQQRMDDVILKIDGVRLDGD